MAKTEVLNPCLSANFRPAGYRQAGFFVYAKIRAVHTRARVRKRIGDRLGLPPVFPGLRVDMPGGQRES